jgi:uncharacterized protein
MKYAGTPFIKVLCGIRRSGKSTILQMIAGEFRKRGIPESCIIQYRFDSLEYDNLKTAKALYTEIKKRLVPDRKAYIFLDEIQEVADWEKAVNSLMQDFDTDIYVTGSNSRMMSSEIATYLTGRYVAFTVYPLSFAEYLDFRKQYTTPSDTHTELARYLKFDGFPALHLRSYTQEEAYTIVYDIYNSVIFSDIVKRSQIREIDQLERIIKYILSNTGSLFSSLAVSKYLKSEHRTIDDETVYRYIAKLESAFILNRCSRYDVRGKEILKTTEDCWTFTTTTPSTSCAQTNLPAAITKASGPCTWRIFCWNSNTRIGRCCCGKIQLVSVAHKPCAAKNNLSFLYKDCILYYTIFV